MEGVPDYNWVNASTTQRAGKRMAGIMPAADLHTNRCCCWFQVTSPSIVVISRGTSTALENPFLSFAELAQSSDEFRMPVVVGVERHVNLLAFFQVQQSTLVNDASKMQYIVVVQIMGLQWSSLLASATKQSDQQSEGIPRFFQPVHDAKALLRG